MKKEKRKIGNEKVNRGYQHFQRFVDVNQTQH